MKTSELTGLALDWAVATAEGYSEWDGECFTSYSDGYPGAFYLQDWKPSSKWADGGAVIEREKISVVWSMTHWIAWTGVIEHKGTTPLEAAMRCYVSGELGSEVDIPDELMETAGGY